MLILHDEIWLLTMSLFGRVVVVTTDKAEVSYDGMDVLVMPTLGEIEIVEAVEWLSGTSVRTSAVVEFLLSGISSDKVIAEGWQLTGIKAELATVRRGTSYHDRQRLIRGLATVALERNSARVRADVAPRQWADTVGQYNKPSDVVNIGTWPSMADSADEKPYPIPFGVVGRYLRSDDTPVVTNAYQIYLVDEASMVALVAGCAIGTGTAIIRDDTNGNEATFNLIEGIDDHGAVVTIAALTVDSGGGPTGWTVDTDTELYIQHMSGGGMVIGGVMLTNAIAVITHVLQQSGAVIDTTSWMAVEEAFGPMLVGYVVREVTSGWDLATKELMKLCPGLYAGNGVDGLRAYATRADWDGAPRLIAGVDIVATGDVQDTVSEKPTSVTATFGYGAIKGENRGKILMSGDQSTVVWQSRDLTNNRLSAGASGSIQIDLPTSDRTTALRVASLLGYLSSVGQTTGWDLISGYGVPELLSPVVVVDAENGDWYGWVASRKITRHTRSISIVRAPE